MSKRQYPVGKAQQMVLDALGLTATGNGHAQEIFKSLGLVVSSKRIGRKSVPSISLIDANVGGMHNGDGWSDTVEFESVDLDKVSQWID